MKKRTWMVLALISLAMLTLTSCIPGDNTVTLTEPAGFFWGIWHGWIAPISLIASLFNSNFAIYEPINTGFWYDFGFYMAIISGFGGLSLGRGKKRRRHRDEDYD